MKLALTVQTLEVEMAIPVALLAGTWDEKLSKAAKLGAQGIELMSADPARLDPLAIREDLARRDLKAVAIGSGAAAIQAGLTLLHPDEAIASKAERRLHELIAFAGAVGAPLVTIGSFRGKLASVESGGRARLAAILRRAAGLAAAAGVRLALEPLNRYEADLVNNAEQGLHFLAEVDHPALGLLLDTYHVNIEEPSWTSPFRLVMEAGKLWHVHLGDNNRLPPGRGLIDFSAIVRTLRDSGYTGFLSAELLGLPDPDTAAEQTLITMRRILEAEACN